MKIEYLKSPDDKFLIKNEKDAVLIYSVDNRDVVHIRPGKFDFKNQIENKFLIKINKSQFENKLIYWKRMAQRYVQLELIFPE